MQIRRQKIIAMLSFIIPLMALVAANNEVVVFLLSKWLDFDSGTYNHGILLSIVAFYYLWTKSEFKFTAKINWLGVLICLGLIVLTFAANIIHVASVQVLSLYLFIWCLIFTMFGWQTIKTSFWPLVLLSFALPLWGAVGILLQKLTLEVSYYLVYLSGIPVLKEGFQIIIPSGRFEVTPGCSGLSYFLAAAALAIVYAMMNYTSKRHFFIVISSIIFVSIVANWVRVYIIILAGYFTDMQHSLLEDHFNLGWILFGLFFIVLLILFNKKLDVQNADSKDVIENNDDKNKNTVVVVPLTILIIIGALSGYQYYVNNKQANYNPDKLALLNSQPINQVSKSSLWREIGQQYIGARERYYQTTSKDEKIQIYEAFYDQQTQGKELVQESNLLYNKQVWKVVSNTTIKTDNGEIGELHLSSFASRKPITLFYWYFIEGKRTTSGTKQKINELLSFIRGEKSAMAYVVLANNKIAAKRWVNLIRSNRD